MSPSAFVASLEDRGVALWRDSGGELHYDAPVGVLTEPVKRALVQAAPHILPLLPIKEAVPAPKLTADDGFDGEPATDTPATPVASVKTKESAETPVQLVWEQGRRIPFMVVCWIGKTGDRFSPGVLSNQHGFGDSKAGALKNLLATMGSIGTPGNLRRIVGRVYAELETLGEGEKLDTVDLATTAHGLPPVFEWKPGGKYNPPVLLSVRFADGCYLEAKGADQAEAWETMQRHPAATPEQQWWLLRGSPVMVAA